jgi:hypothetical protein
MHGPRVKGAVVAGADVAEAEAVAGAAVAEVGVAGVATDAVGAVCAQSGVKTNKQAKSVFMGGRRLIISMGLLVGKDGKKGG